jgi:pyruvate/2-oxoglutarate dehydrogenase complex dihydrolipoamide acyltransferase (E2) component
VTEVRSSLQGTVAHIPVAVGAPVIPGAELVLIEAMKMLYPVTAEAAGTVADLRVAVGALVQPGDVLLTLDEVVTADDAAAPATPAAQRTPDGRRPDLAEVVDRHHGGTDDGRPEAVARRHAAGKRTARENVADLCDPDSFVEYGPLVVAAQRQRRSLAELIERTPADGVVVGIGRLAGRPIGVVAYDYTVLAGTQGFQGHRKQDRLFDVAARSRLPLVIFAEGGGGRPGETDGLGVAGLDVPASPASPASARWCRWSASWRVAATPATPPSSASATSSSPPPTPTSGWAARP